MQKFHLEDPMGKVILGVQKFQAEIYKDKQALFQTLAKRQDPKILFITCSDSRIDPSLITQTGPGDMFLIHNAGNIIPPYGTPYGGTAASIEYAVAVLDAQHIIVCGHGECGAMKALLNLKSVEANPIIRQWLSYAETSRAIIEAEEVADDDERLQRCIERNVQVQLAHLQMIPSVAAKLASGNLSLHGWVYHIESGEIDVFEPEAQRFTSFAEAYGLHSSLVT